VTQAASWRLTEKTYMTLAVRRQACHRGLDEAVSAKDVDKAVQEAATEVS